MNLPCIKCKKDTTGGSIITEGGISYNFCKECADILSYCPTGCTVTQFVGDNSKTQVERNIKLAKQRRALGISIW